MSPLRWALLGLEYAGPKSYRPATTDELSEWLGREVDDNIVRIVRKFEETKRPEDLAKAVQKLDVARDDLGQAMEVCDQSIKYVESNGTKPGRFRHRHIPYIVKGLGDGSIYMAKSVNGNKATALWEQNPKNIIVQVDDYDEFEVLGWKKLSEFEE